MKKCPACGYVSADDDLYCPEDGTDLVAAHAPSVFETPTQFIPTPARPAKTAGDSRSPMVYLAIGAMGATIAALAVAVYMMSGGIGKPLAEAAPTSPAASSNSAPISDLNESPPKISIEGAAHIIEKWERSQDTRNFLDYRSCYAPGFLGIKRTPSGSRKQLDLSGWLADRQPMLRNMVELQVEDLKWSIENDAAVAVFTQRFRSVNYCDVGRKTLRFKMSRDGPRIVFEELTDPVRCY